jgi:predicted O-methyltransferase YrrM
MSLSIRGDNRISRFHDEKGNFVDAGGLINAVPAFCSAAGKRVFGYRPKVPMISYRARRLIAKLLTSESRVVEFGSGNSTPWFAARVAFVLSVEDDPEWYGYVERILADSRLENVRHVLRSASDYADISDVADASIDFALVDGTDREGCVRAVVPKLKRGAWLYLDNSDKDMTIPNGDLRRAEAALSEIVKARCGTARFFSDFSPTNFFVEQGVLARL